MSPRAETLLGKDGRPTTMLLVDLLSPETLDIPSLDEKLKQAALSDEDSGVVKFIVINDKLIAFWGRMEHGKAYEDFKRTFGISGKPQCAGSISFNFTGDETQGPRRKIFDYSVSLAYSVAPANRLSTEDSDHYKKTVLKEKLGKHFVIK